MAEPAFVNSNGQVVYYPDYDVDQADIEERDECNICGRTEYMCPGH